MDQKRAMLYPQVDFNTPSAPSPTPTPTRESVGPELVPVEAPPSYDVAIGSNAVTVPAIPAIAVTQQPPHVVYEYEQPAQPTVVQMDTMNLGPNPCRVLCPACGAQKTTRMTHTANSRTHMGAGLLCLVGWCCFACFVPYCMNSCRTGNHYCRKCNTFLGAYSPNGLK
ncbi:GL11368 [Drosophila persimilis]|uniref:Lipopolysaccharide-induced tumor necrosis factor-alpha factor homolog n=2 Tax=pseudoobscura subgroup TaxID=32358 RepID=A0A6I8V435_DROPS|nr:lipopolysaccharide-induced tumor necrosis factor-alpha factor homolog [Drosophila persimilis]XP_002138327.1 lipopolysaccharide-induced tumor necrosis factor-alpha factor homolog [Drosophila pseudoobscura]XP_017150017.1 lipopolysaccharide-induced tumor necrosis factor-alpha factor homolog [Drosophila miranda]EDW31909.1 GL11368 [Drosophila persimilis]